jgi:hypothetical protein
MLDGYYQVLCKAGHQATEDVENFDTNNWFCRVPRCRRGVAWYNFVEIMGGERAGDEPEYVKLKKIQSGKVHECQNCGHMHQCPPAIFEIPRPGH